VLQPDQIKELEEAMKLEGEKIFSDNAGRLGTGEGIAETVSEFEKVDAFKRISFYGFLKRATTDRIVDVKFTKDGSIFGVQSAGKVIEFFNVHTEEEIQKKRKRRQKRQREKARKKAEEDGVEVPGLEFSPKPADEYSSKQVILISKK
jgi:hypothetical protein